MSTFDGYGLAIDSFATIAGNLETSLKAAFGQNLKTDPQSIFGQLIQLFSLLISEQNELVSLVAASYDPNAAQGVFLDNLIQLNGLTRIAGVYSTVDVECEVDDLYITIPAGSLIADSTGQQWVFENDLVFSGSTHQVATVRATAVGPISAATGTITTIVTPVAGWVAVENIEDATEGRLEETDAELRVRRNSFVESSAITSVKSIQNGLLSIDGVSAVKIIENAGKTTDSDGVPPQHLKVLIIGGNDEEIAEMIFSRLAGGIGTVGDEEILHTDADTGIEKTIFFTRPTEVEINVDLEISLDPRQGTYPAGAEALIEAALEEYFLENQHIGSDVLYSRLYSPIQSINGFYISSLQIQRGAGSFVSTNISLAHDEIARFNTLTFAVV